MSFRLQFIALGLFLLSAGVSAIPVYTTDFAIDPFATGWTVSPTVWGEETATRWAEPGEDGYGHCLEVTDGQVQSPAFPVKDGQYYRLRFTSQAVSATQWAVLFFDDRGKALDYGHYSSIEPSPAWHEQEFYFTTKYPGVTAAVAFRAAESTLQVCKLCIDPMRVADTEAHVLALEESLPMMTVPALPTGSLPRTVAKLKCGGPLRIVIFGDSIANDLSNSPLDVLLEREYPNARVELRYTGHGGTSYDTFQRYVNPGIVRHKPDLVILLSITNHYDQNMGAALQHIINVTRQGLPKAEILLVTPHVDIFSPHIFSGSAQREVLHFIANNNGLPVVDLLQTWQDYLTTTCHERSWLLRDIIHMNERGHLLTAKAVLAAFQ